MAHLIGAPAVPSGIDVYIVEEQANPSTDYFVLPAISSHGCRVHRCSSPDALLRSDLENAFVIFVRYIPTAWRRKIRAERQRLAGLAFFMDDDMLDVGATTGLPLKYRLKLYGLAARHTGWLREQQAQLWVSTAWLAEKYAAWRPTRLYPRPSREAIDLRRVFYHGSASHEAEIRWLHPVMAEVLRANERVVFEIIGGADVRRLYGSLPRVAVVHPMKWVAYQAFMDLQGRHIGLVPMLDRPFNRARSHTKFFDITRSGGVGIYTEGTEYATVVQDRVHGRVLRMRPAEWIDAILELAENEESRLECLAHARNTLATWY